MQFGELPTGTHHLHPQPAGWSLFLQVSFLDYDATLKIEAIVPSKDQALS
jgi:hypothetical protein